MKTTGEYLVGLLEQYAVENVFGIPGVHTVELYRGLENSPIRHYTPRHEQGAGFMADGYARVSGKPGVCFIITGPGLTNIATAMGQACADSIPMLVISAVNATGNLGQGKGHLHELPNQSALMSQISAFSHTLMRVDDLPSILARAFAVFDGARPLPVHIEIPLDVMVESADHMPAPRRAAKTFPPRPTDSQIDTATTALDAAERIVLCVGGGAKRCTESVRALAEKLDAPVVATVNARGVLAPEHPLLVPASPSLDAVRALIEDADVVLALGTEIGRTDYDFGDSEKFKIPGKLIRVDIDPGQTTRNWPADIALIGDAGSTCELLARSVAGKRQSAGADRAANTRTAAMAELSKPMREHVELLNKIRNALPDAILVGDSSQQAYAGALYFAAQTPVSWFNSATGYGTLGYALPAAIGAKIAARDRPILCLVGDGGLQFSIAELASAIDAETPIVLLVWNNNGYGEIKAFMLEKNIATEGVDLFTPDFLAIAGAYGFSAEKLSSLDDIETTLSNAVSSNSPWLIQLEESELIPNKRLNPAST